SLIFAPNWSAPSITSSCSSHRPSTTATIWKSSPVNARSQSEDKRRSTRSRQRLDNHGQVTTTATEFAYARQARFQIARRRCRGPHRNHSADRHHVLPSRVLHARQLEHGQHEELEGE